MVSEKHIYARTGHWNDFLIFIAESRDAYVYRLNFFMDFVNLITIISFRFVPIAGSLLFPDFSDTIKYTHADKKDLSACGLYRKI